MWSGIDPDAIMMTEGIQIKGYVPELYKHFASCDLAIVQGGGTTTIELAALNKNFLYFPLEEHFEQKLVSDKLESLGVGVKMNFLENGRKHSIQSCARKLRKAS